MRNPKTEKQNKEEKKVRDDTGERKVKTKKEKSGARGQVEER